MSNSKEYKEQVYNEWLTLTKQNPGKAISMSMEEAAIVDEMQRRNKKDKELEQRTKEIREKYGKHGLISDRIFDLDNY